MLPVLSPGQSLKRFMLLYGGSSLKETDNLFVLTVKKCPEIFRGIFYLCLYIWLIYAIFFRNLIKNSMNKIRALIIAALLFSHTFLSGQIIGDFIVKLNYDTLLTEIKRITLDARDVVIIKNGKKEFVPAAELIAISFEGAQYESVLFRKNSWGFMKRVIKGDISLYIINGSKNFPDQYYIHQKNQQRGAIDGLGEASSKIKWDKQLKEIGCSCPTLMDSLILKTEKKVTQYRTMITEYNTECDRRLYP